VDFYSDNVKKHVGFSAQSRKSTQELISNLYSEFNKQLINRELFTPIHKLSEEQLSEICKEPLYKPSDEKYVQIDEARRFDYCIALLLQFFPSKTSMSYDKFKNVIENNAEYARSATPHRVTHESR
jgi:hypothetical protein